MYGRNPPVIAYVVPIQNGAQFQDGSAQIFQAVPVSHSGSPMWASSGPGDQIRVMPPGQVPAQSQYAQYSIVPQQLLHQQPQQQQQMWGAPVQPQGLHPHQRVVTHNQWHAQQHRQVYGQGCANITPQQSQQPQQQRRRRQQQQQQQQQQPHGVAVAVFQELAQQNHQQQWVSQAAAPLGSVPPNPSVQNVGRDVGRIPPPIHPVGPFGSPENGSRGRLHNQNPNTHHRSQVKQKRWVKGSGEDTAPNNQHKAQAEPPSSSGRANALSGPNGVDHGAAKASSGGTVAEGSRGEVGSTDAFFCEPCEKDFSSEAARQAHLQSHETCSEPGCNFSASRKVLNAHHSAAHGQFSGTGFQTITVEGQKFRVLLGTRPEDVAEWRSARRKHWPSDKTIVRKEEEERKRRELGGLGPEAVSGVGRGAGRGGGGRGRGGKRLRTKGGAERGENDRNDILGVYGPSDAAAQVVDLTTSATEGSVTGKRPCEESCAETTAKAPRIEGKESRGDSNIQGVESEGTATAAVVQLASTSADGEEAEGVMEGEVSGDDSASPGRKGKKRICMFYLKGKCSKGEECTFDHDVVRRNCSFFLNGRCIYGKSCTFIHDPEARAKARQEASGTEAPTPADRADVGKNGGGERRKAVAKKMLSPSKQTLLRKLLAPQLHRESNIALQAVRFIVKSNFFLLDTAPSSADNACSSSGEPACGAKESNGSEVTLGHLLEGRLSSADESHSAEESSSTGVNVNAMASPVDCSSLSAADASPLEENVLASVSEVMAPTQEKVVANSSTHPVSAAVEKAEASCTEASCVQASCAEASSAEVSRAEVSSPEASNEEASSAEMSSAETSGAGVYCTEAVNSEEKGIAAVTDAPNRPGRDAIGETAARSGSSEAREGMPDS